MNIRNISLSILMIGGLFASSAVVAVSFAKGFCLVAKRLPVGAVLGALACITTVKLDLPDRDIIIENVMTSAIAGAGIGAAAGAVFASSEILDLKMDERKQKKAALQQKLAAEKLADSKIE